MGAASISWLIWMYSVCELGDHSTGMDLGKLLVILEILVLDPVVSIVRNPSRGASGLR